MSEDEAIKILNDYLCKTHRKFCSIGAVGIPEKEYFAIEILLELYQKEKEKNKKIQNHCKELIKEKQELNTSLLYDNVNKDKIKAKIKEYQEKRRKAETEKINDMFVNYIDILEELLED